MKKPLSAHLAKTAKTTLFFSFFALVFSVSSAFAGTSTLPPEFGGSVGDLMNQHSNDDFGQQIINWIAFGKPDGVKFGDVSLLSTISFTLNALALVMMAYLSLLGGLTYVIQTANKGTPGGQVVSSFWMPIRIATATILLVPLSSGYSTIQYGVITVAEKGNAHGSWLMNQGIDYIAKNGVYRPPAIESNRDIVMGLVLSELCRIHINTTEESEVITIQKSSFNTPVNTTLNFDYEKKTSKLQAFFRKLTPSPAKGYCGSVSLVSPDADASSFKKNQAHSTSGRLFSFGDYEDDAGILASEEITKYIESTVIPAARSIAVKLSADSADLKSMQNGGGKAAQSTYERNQKGAEAAATGLAGEINAIVENYDAKVHQILQASIMAMNKHNTTETSTGAWGAAGYATNESAAGTTPWVKQVKEAGWPALGTVFWQISKNQESLNYLAKRVKATYSEPRIDQQYMDDERYSTLSARLSDLIKASENSGSAAQKNTFDMTAIKKAGADGTTGQIKTWIATAFQSLMLTMFIPDDDGDLITKLQYSGSVLTSLTDLLVHASIWGDAAAVTAKEVADRAHRDATLIATSVPLAGSVAGTAASVGAFLLSTPASFAANLGIGYMKFVSTLIVPLLIAGFALAVVLPTIPLFFWLMGVVSWMLFFVECLLVSPSWLAAHGTAEKDGWGSEHTRQGYMLMIGLWLNPILRVAGFYAIFLVLIPLGRMVNWLSEYLVGVVSSGWMSPVIIVGSMVILAVFAYSSAVRVFSLPNELFERGLRWLNGGQEVTGDSGAEHQNRMIIAQVGGKADGAAQAAKHLRGQNTGPRPPVGGSPSSPQP